MALALAVSLGADGGSNPKKFRTMSYEQAEEVKGLLSTQNDTLTSQLAFLQKQEELTQWLLGISVIVMGVGAICAIALLWRVIKA